ncbi:two-component response regulator-like APRR7 isoform X1 [Cynara cardunculus var. scolymus]|uniref:two-component response regulator-like APRR7 isoform X1 n=1 Tax=Cynara cardunculus var. scolymus TaxID=59895 RepID=UPI000D63034A|nr:two-component response regulator-like APRR7 isoform X1 [Cynara cardunculus var. scolymus]XP_024980797.1 two-component response regulator-like APRR7 isoform X1 [Cynara cardunculus var. scolymus]XP_024980806.1 two-component response regulator-like APRR7 isoform X1 [Cynara cardunculus var. scolymus]XP_024980814.1 two-component response regulator-like APRR7 isoform X1 [Cynara cardunculus var. scolymus]XP_024980820.1 two-component response regulator-like APRR7 isoform X1 [Cynara cardunculus var. 
MTSSGGGSKGFQQVNSCVKAEYQGDVNGFVGIEPGSHGDDESRTRRVDENVQDGCNQVTVQENAAPQQQLQGSLVHWERFLHVRSIKVMLVEDDDCTRHIVTALLRNCNYEVIEAANGFQAWKILENLSNHIDIVLTEVVMPCLSGISLLCKIMCHKTRKNIPVIMMSSHDSMGLVFKCLSKGAVDFLVKPVRKNELKNLWQHVWRRCHSSSGSGSESGTQAQKSVNSKSNLRYDDSGNKDGDENGSTSGGSDDGSGTQSSWTKQAVEPESPEAASPCDQIAEHPDSTCGLVIRPVQTQATRDINDQEGRPYNDGKAKEIAEMQIQSTIEVPIKHNGIKQNTHQVFDPTLNVKSKGMGISDIRREHTLTKHKADDSKMPESYMENGELEGQGEPEKIMDANTKVVDDSNGVIVGEPGLKRPRATKHDGREVQNGCNILRHSELSAFTRYKITSNAVKDAPGITASRSQPDNRSNTVKKESKHDAHSDGYLIYQGSSEQVIPRKADAGVLHQEHRIQHIHHHHHVHHYHNIDEEEPLSNHGDFGLNKLGADAPHCGSSNIMGGPVEGNLETYSLNRSASGSKHGSNVQIGSNTAVNFEATNVESDVGLARKSGSGDASGSGNGSGTRNRIDQHKSAHREAALTKFRQKREVRCFQKKVRYQNRKKLAEQRPRVRGQFVKGTSQDGSSNAAGD